MAVHDMLMAAAGVSTGTATYVDDVFSTYLYSGDGYGQAVENGIALGNGSVNGTVLHLTGDSLADSAPVPNRLTFSGMTVNTSVKKYGTGSLYFDGSGTSTVWTDSTKYNMNLGTGDFTIETWMYMTDAPSSQYIRVLWASDGGYNFTFTDSDQLLYFGTPGGSIATSKTKTNFLNTWRHIAAVRNGSTITVYIDGVVEGTLTYSGNLNIGSQNTFVIGGTYPVDPGYPFTGYMDDFRIVKGTAKYTAAFTPPTSALPIDTLTDTGKGGLVWIKSRNNAAGSFHHNLFDTVRGTNKRLFTSLTNAESVDSPSKLTALANGFGINGDLPNSLTTTYASWTFRKQAKFFDVVTYTGNGSFSRNISHSLGSTPGFIIIKKTSSTGNWISIARKNSTTYYTGLFLNTTDAASSEELITDVATSTTVDVGYLNAAVGATNDNGATYVAYLFAHDAGGFGAAGTDNVISCGSFTTDSGGNASVNLGYEPQWVMYKAASTTSAWVITDNMRGWYAPYNACQRLFPNTTNAEVTTDVSYVNSTGMTFGSSATLSPNATYIYIAIRRPMKPPTTGTEVFNTAFGQTTAPGFQPNIVTDSYFMFYKPGDGTYPRSSARLIGNKNLQTSSTAAENTDAEIKWDYQNGTYVGAALDSTFVAECFKRAPGFHDVVCYTGTGSVATRNHNLGVAPEMIFLKSRSDDDSWYVYVSSLGATQSLQLQLNSTPFTDTYLGGTWNSTTPTSTAFYNGEFNGNMSGSTYVAYLFATLAGVSKVGSYTGTGSTQQINCGFSGGARFVLIKRTDSTGDWYVWDTARGIVSGNDPYLRLNSTGGEVTSTDYIDPYSAGFEISSTAPAAINANGGSYIYLAIA